MRSKMSAIGTSDSAFHDGNPSTGELGTIVTADWLNAVQASTMDLQDELLNVLAAASIANAPAVKTQILTAIKKLSQSGSFTFATDTGAANTYVVSLIPALTSRAEGQVIRVKVANTNTGASTINDGLGVVPLTGGAHSALQGGEMIAGGDAWVQWNSTVGSGSYVLLFCTGAAEQLANGKKSQHAAALNQITSVVGSARNVVMSVTAASATATLTADEIIVETALGGLKYQLSNFSKTINLSTTGAGGMDTGTAPVSGYVALYVILNTTTGTSALLATNATSAKATEVYSGANMPSGYTASALISIWPTNASGQFAVGYQIDRDITTINLSALSTTSTQATLTSLSIASCVPLNAKKVKLSMGALQNTAASGVGLNVGASSSSVGLFGISAVATSGMASQNSFYKLSLVTPQVIYWQTQNATSGTYSIGVNGYSF